MEMRGEVLAVVVVVVAVVAGTKVEEQLLCRSLVGQHRIITVVCECQCSLGYHQPLVAILQLD